MRDTSDKTRDTNSVYGLLSLDSGIDLVESLTQVGKLLNKLDDQVGRNPFYSR